MSRRRIVVWIVIALALAPIVMLALASQFSKRPDNLAGPGGQLAPCPRSPNCVCTLDQDAEHGIQPLTFTGPADVAWQRLQQVVAAQPRAAVITAQENYLHVEFTSLVFRFVDDVEFILRPDQGVIDFRSASRAGHSDLGVNRQRMESIRRGFEAAAPAKETE